MFLVCFIRSKAMVNLSIRTYITLHTNQQQIPLENIITLIQELKCSKLNIICFEHFIKTFKNISVKWGKCILHINKKNMYYI